MPYQKGITTAPTWFIPLMHFNPVYRTKCEVINIKIFWVTNWVIKQQTEGREHTSTNCRISFLQGILVRSRQLHSLRCWKQYAKLLNIFCLTCKCSMKGNVELGEYSGWYTLFCACTNRIHCARISTQILNFYPHLIILWWEISNDVLEIIGWKISFLLVYDAHVSFERQFVVFLRVGSLCINQISCL